MHLIYCLNFELGILGIPFSIQLWDQLKIPVIIAIKYFIHFDL